MPLGGITEQILVKDGDRVEKGQVLIRLDTEASTQANKSLQISLELKKNQLALKEIELQRYISQNQNSINTLKQRIIFESGVAAKFKSLMDEGAAAEFQYLQQQHKVTETKGGLRETELDGQRNIAILEQDLQRMKSEIAELQTRITEAQVTLRYQELRSPVDGVVFDLRAKGPGYTAPTTEFVMRVVPFNALEAKIEIPSRSIGFVQKGMQADISIDSFPASDFGVLEGTVTQLGSDALPPDPSKQKTQHRYPATIQLSSQQIKLKNGQELELQPGMSLSANIKLRKVSYLQMLLGSFQDKADSLRRIGG